MDTEVCGYFKYMYFHSMNMYFSKLNPPKSSFLYVHQVTLNLYMYMYKNITLYSIFRLILRKKKKKFFKRMIQINNKYICDPGSAVNSTSIYSKLFTNMAKFLTEVQCTVCIRSQHFVLDLKF